MAKINTFKITLEYDGARYHGWQVQKNVKTVQGCLFDAIKEATGISNFELYGAGRTDKGVHALNQTAHLKAPIFTPTNILTLKINDLLPADIVVKSIERASDAFHARKSAVARSYVYHISQRKTAFGKPYVWWIKDILNLKEMESAAAMLIGTHDFSLLSDIESQNESTKIRVYQSSISVDGDVIIFRICAQSFLWKMVRKIVTALVEVGRGNITTADFSALLSAQKTSRKVEATAPPSGLFLENIYYAQSEITEVTPRSFVSIR